MNALNQTLKELLIKELNPGFTKALIERISAIYPESYYRMIEDKKLGDEEAKYVLGHYRRGLAETVLTQTAVEFGLNVKRIQPEGGGCTHVYLTFGHFGLVMCHVSTSDAFPPHSGNREQSAQVNEHLSQMSLLAEGEILDEEEFYGIMIHTEQSGKKEQFSSVKIGFPNTNFDGWVEEPICLQQLVEIQQQLFEPQEDLQAQVQMDKPVWKSTDTDKKASSED